MLSVVHHTVEALLSSFKLTSQLIVIPEQVLRVSRPRGLVPCRPMREAHGKGRLPVMGGPLLLPSEGAGTRMEMDYVHRHLSDAAGGRTSREFDARLTQCILPHSDAPSLSAPFSFCLPRLVVQEGIESVPIDYSVDRVVRSLRLPCLSVLSLRPIVTAGDGDCLLHAICITIWGFHDKNVRLRSLLVEWVLSPTLAPRLLELFIRGEQRDDAVIGVERTREELIKEWETHVVANAVSRHEYLSRFHIFCLAHIIRRPIIVIADSYVRASDGSIFSPLAMRGLYLPILVPASGRSKAPIMVCYTVSKGSQGHFTALVSVDGHGKVVPLQDETGTTLPTPYAEDVSLEAFFDVCKEGDMWNPVLCARLSRDPIMSPESYKIRESLLSEASKELKARATKLYMAAEEADRQATAEARLRQEAERRLIGDALYDQEESMDTGLESEAVNLITFSPPSSSPGLGGGQSRPTSSFVSSPSSLSLSNNPFGFENRTSTTSSTASGRAMSNPIHIPVMGPISSRLAPVSRPDLRLAPSGGLTRQDATSYDYLSGE